MSPNAVLDLRLAKKSDSAPEIHLCRWRPGKGEVEMVNGSFNVAHLEQFLTELSVKICALVAAQAG